MCHLGLGIYADSDNSDESSESDEANSDSDSDGNDSYVELQVTKVPYTKKKTLQTVLIVSTLLQSQLDRKLAPMGFLYRSPRLIVSY